MNTKDWPTPPPSPNGSPRSANPNLITHDLRESIFLADQVVVLSGRPAKTQFVMDIPNTGLRTLDHLYTPEAAEMLNTLRHKIEVAQGRARAEAPS